MNPVTEAKKRARGMCCQPFCRKKAYRNSGQCNRCKKRKWREAHPIHYLFDNLRTHARERSKSFTLTLAEFTTFCLETGYHETKGRKPSASTIDRVRPWEGYRNGNIRVLTHQANSERQDTPPNSSDLQEVKRYEPHEDPFAA